MKKNIIAILCSINICTYMPVTAIAAVNSGGYTYNSYGEAIINTTDQDAIVDSDDIIESANRLNVLEGQTEFLRQGNTFEYNENETYYYIKSPDGNESKLGAYGNALPENVLKGKTFTSAVSEVGAEGTIHSIGDDILDGEADRLTYFTYDFPRNITKTSDRDPLNITGLLNSSSDSYTKTGVYSADLGLDQYMVIPKGINNTKTVINNSLYDWTKIGQTWTEYVTNADNTVMPAGYYKNIEFTNILPESNNETDEVWHHKHVTTGSLDDANNSHAITHTRAVQASDPFGESDNYSQATPGGCFQTPVYHMHSTSSTIETSNIPNASNNYSLVRGGCYQKEVHANFKYNHPVTIKSFTHENSYANLEDAFEAAADSLGSSGVTKSYTNGSVYSTTYNNSNTVYDSNNKDDIFSDNANLITLGKANKTDSVTLADRYGKYTNDEGESEWYAIGTGWRDLTPGATGNDLRVRSAFVVTSRKIYAERDITDGVNITTYTNEAAVSHYSYNTLSTPKYVIDNAFVVFEITSPVTEITGQSGTYFVSQSTLFEANCGKADDVISAYIKSCKWKRGQVMKETITLTHTNVSP